jgi:hypothetical protein
MRSESLRLLAQSFHRLALLAIVPADFVEKRGRTMNRSTCAGLSNDRAHLGLGGHAARAHGLSSVSARLWTLGARHDADSLQRINAEQLAAGEMAATPFKSGFKWPMGLGLLIAVAVLAFSWKVRRRARGETLVDDLGRDDPGADWSGCLTVWSNKAADVAAAR